MLLRMRIPGRTGAAGRRGHPRDRPDPLVASIVVARAVIARVSATAFQPSSASTWTGRSACTPSWPPPSSRACAPEADAIVAADPLRGSAFTGDAQRLEGELTRIIAAHPRWSRSASRALRRRSRRSARARPPGGSGAREDAHGPEGDRARTRPRRGARGSAPTTAAATATSGPSSRRSPRRARASTSSTGRRRSRRRTTPIEREHRKEYLDQSYGDAFAALLGATILLADPRRRARGAPRGRPRSRGSPRATRPGRGGRPLGARGAAGR